MKIRLERTQPILALFIAFHLAFCLAYLQYNELIEIDILSPRHSFENPDQENLLPDHQGKAKIFIQGFSPAVCFLSFILIKQPSRFSFQIDPLDGRIPVLRC